MGSTLVTEILGILFAGLSTTATSMGSAIVAMVQAIFLTSGESHTLNVFGVLIVVFAGITLALSLFRWALNFVTSWGNRNR